MPFQKRLQAPVNIHFLAEAPITEKAREALDGSGFTISDYLRAALADLAEGRVKLTARPSVKEPDDISPPVSSG